MTKLKISAIGAKLLKLAGQALAPKYKPTAIKLSSKLVPPNGRAHQRSRKIPHTSRSQMPSMEPLLTTHQETREIQGITGRSILNKRAKTGFIVYPK
ncbi:MAG TPA: hypothetical protein VFK94_05555 [Patescibacteria group bacterium]|nr:hypothetical protein [Patescibacteria group bacterium]